MPGAARTRLLGMALLGLSRTPAAGEYGSGVPEDREERESGDARGHDDERLGNARHAA
jgi:hypothetical protein